MRPLLLALLFAACASPERDAHTPVTPAADSASAAVTSSTCVAVEGTTTRVCRDIRDGETRGRLFVEREGRTVAEWPHAFMPVFDSLEVHRLDLDGDAQPELVVASLDAQSNGPGVMFWTISVLHDTGAPGTPLSFTTNDYAFRGTFPVLDGAPRILATAFEGAADPSGERGEGMYFVGRFYRYERGRLIPEARPVLTRRYTNAFANERSGSLGEPSHNPYRWLQTAAESRSADPWLLGRPVRETRGTLRGDTLLTDPLPLYADHVADVRFGDPQTRRLYPESYRPAGGLDGHPVRLEAFDLGYAERRVLWLETP